MKRFLRNLFGFMLCWLASNVYAQQEQKPSLDHSVYKIWQNVGGFQLTDDGKYASYLTNVGEGDGSVSVVNLKTTETTTLHRGSRANFSHNGKYIYYTIRPFHEQTKEASRKKLKGDKAPKDTLGIFNLKTKELVKFPALKKVESPREKGDFIAFNIEVETQDAIADSTANKKKSKSKKEVLTLIYDFKNGVVVDTLKHIDVMAFDNQGEQLFCIAVDSTKKLFVYNPSARTQKVILEAHKKADMQRPVISDDGTRIAFYANTDSTKKFDDNVEIYTCRMNVEELKPVKLITNAIEGLPEGMKVSKNRAITFNKEGSRLFFGITYPIAQKDTTIKEEQASLDVWHYQDPYIATQYLQMKGMLQKRSYLSMVELDTLDYSLKGKMIQLATEEYPIPTVPNEWSSNYAYAHTSQPYLVQSQWDANPIGDLYIISLVDGSSRLLAKGSYVFGMHTSPSGDYLVWFNPEDNQYYSMDLRQINKGTLEDFHSEIKTVKISGDIPYPLWKESHDKPQMANPYGNGGWSEDEKTFYVYDKYDVWELDPLGKRKAEMLTQGLGREKGYTFKMMRWDAMQLPDGTPGIKKTPIKPTDNIYFTAFDNKSKGTGYFMRKVVKGKWQPMKELIMEPDFQLGYLNKAKDANIITYTKANFTESQNLWVTSNLFKTSKKLTNANPQQKDYNWGTCESVYWKAYDGKELEGLLYKPENFDPTKKYPMVVYFYETSSQYKHAYRKPDVSRSTINITYFVSNGYLVFMPDIHYTVGHPGKSAYNCIVSGVENLCKNNWVDKDNIAIQGQSWGGYQVAYLVTQTDMFKCAGSGAPVANMTSAYGGIRWGSGVVRQFQYEHTQSRIGKTMWDKGGFELYIENSPIFFADKVKTPLLIMHNDKDEAVPWYQGIEYFTALRRLGKPVWMLQYNNETHNLSKRVNALDYTIRLSQFMDHFLKGAPMPKWMKYGVPSTIKGIDYGLELVNE